MNKRSLTIVTISALVFLLLIGLIYYFFFRSEREEVGTQTPDDWFGFPDPGLVDSTPLRNPVEYRDDAGRRIRYRMISREPVAGAVWTASTTEETLFNAEGEEERRVESVPILRYSHRATGHIYQTPYDTFTETRVSNVTVPQIYEAIWASPSVVIMRFLNDNGYTIETVSGRLVEVGQSLALQSSSLPSGISTLAVSPAGNQLFYLLGSTGTSRGYISNPDGSEARQVFSSPLSQWLADWKGAGITLTTKASARSEGFTYNVNQSTGNLTRLAGGKNGFTSLVNATGDFLLFSESGEGGRLSLGIIDNNSGITIPLNTSSIPEKCVWSQRISALLYCAVPKSFPNGIYPDSWYQGKMSFDDIIVRINITTGEVEQILDPEEFGEPEVDITQIILNDEETALAFIDKKTSSLWSLEFLDEENDSSGDEEEDAS